MSKNNTLKKIVIATAVVGAAMYAANEYIMKISANIIFDRAFKNYF